MNYRLLSAASFFSFYELFQHVFFLVVGKARPESNFLDGAAATEAQVGIFIYLAKINARRSVGFDGIGHEYCLSAFGCDGARDFGCRRTAQKI